MTHEEAEALVLREALVAKDAPDNALLMVLHDGRKPIWDQVRRLAEAIDTMHEAIEAETVIERNLAGALWIIGIESYAALDKDWQPRERDDLLSIVNAVESALVGFWPIGHPRDKDGVTNGNGTA